MQTTQQTALAFLAFRFGLGINMALHGLTRLPMLEKFAAKTVEQFQGTILPAPMVTAFAYSLSFAEAIIGLLLLVGFHTGWTLFAANLLIGMLMFGTALRQDWATLGSQLVYAIAFFLAHLHVHHDRYSIDAFFTRKP